MSEAGSVAPAQPQVEKLSTSIDALESMVHSVVGLLGLPPVEAAEKRPSVDAIDVLIGRVDAITEQVRGVGRSLEKL